MAKKDYYEILGVPRTASADDLRRAHRKFALKYHPDRNKGDTAAEERFKEVQEAYDILSDPAKRKNYDQFGHAGVGAGAPQGGDPFEAFRRAQGRGGPGPGHRTWQASPGVSVEDFDLGGEGGFANIFEQMFGGRAAGGGGGGPGFGGRAGPRARAQPQRGADVEHPVTLTFPQAARGTKLPLQISRDGKVETIEIKIPPGVKDGSRIRIKGRGQPSHGEAGDLFIITQVLPHDFYKRDGLNVVVELPLSLYEALLGTKLEVPTLDGSVTLTIPPGTSSGAKLRIKGRGVQRGDDTGDQFVVIKIVVPRDLDDDDRAAIEQLARKHPLDARADIRW